MFVTGVAEGPFSILQQHQLPVYVSVQVLGCGAAVTGVCVGARRGFVTTTVSLCAGVDI